jgi:hypothetical protein
MALAGALVLGGCSAGGSPSTGSVAMGGGLQMSPSPATSVSRIAVVFADDRMRQVKCAYEWRRNGNLIPDATTSGLDPSQFSKNDEITVTVNATGPEVGGEKTFQGKVRVINTPPMLTSVTVALAVASGVPQLETHVGCADPDGDVPTYSYRWLKNGAPIEGATAASLPLSLLGRGDRVTVEVVARDDESSSPPLTSEPFTLDNRPPAFTSQPMTPTPRDQVFEYHATAADPDGDPLRFELVTGPAGMIVDPSGAIRWELPTKEDRHGTFPVRIRASDGKGGEATQDFTISLDPPPGKTS